MTDRDTTLDTVFDHPPDRRGGDSLKWNKYASAHPGAIGAWVADMDFSAPPAVLAALQARLDGPALGYCDEPPELLPTVIARLERLYNWRVEPEWIVSIPGIVPGLFGAVRASGETGSGVIAQTPNYPRFYSAAEYSDRRLLPLPSSLHNGRWCIDIEQLEALAPDARTLLLCNPHNPLGTVMTREELTEIARVCLAHNLTVCSDEVHAELVLDESACHIPIASLSEHIARQSITLIGPGKAFNLAGILGFGLAIIPDARLRQAFSRQVYGIAGHVSGLAQLAALTAYRDCDEWLGQLIQYLRRNRDTLEAAVGAMDGVSMTHVEATFLGWLDVSALDLANPHAFFLSHGLALSDGTEMGAPGYLRLNFGCTRATLESMLARLRGAVDSR